nr:MULTISPECIES: HAMP domain-containing sensor histidine kinase [unclassified Actinomyces]
MKKGRFHPVVKASRLWHAQPLRSRLVLITTALLTVGLLSASLAMTSLLQTHLLSQVDDQLRTTATAIGSQGATQIRTGNESLMPSTYYVEAQYLDGESGFMINDDTAREYGVPQVGELSLEEALAQVTGPQPYTVSSDLIGHPWRVISLPLRDSRTGEYLGVVAIALPLTDLLEAVERSRLVVALTDVAIILVGAVAGTYLVHRSFRPLRQIETVAGRIASGDLSARVPLTEPRDTEVGSLQRALNQMLQQNERAFSVQVVAQERMTRFVSDASHELRTPLAAIRGYGELYRMGGVPPERQAEVMGRIETEASRMGRLVEDLLQLARMDEGRKMVLEPVDLTGVCAGALADMAVLAPERDCALVDLLDDGAEPGPVVVTGDRDRLSQVVTNLLGNVTRHTPSGSPVEIAVGAVGTQAGRCAVVEVRDHGPGVPASEAEKVFQRFYRADTSRNRETGGSGLGLAIVSAIVGRHGGSVRMLQTPGGGATVRIEIPLAPPGPMDSQGSPGSTVPGV